MRISKTDVAKFHKILDGKLGKAKIINQGKYDIFRNWRNSLHVYKLWSVRILPTGQILVSAGEHTTLWKVLMTFDPSYNASKGIGYWLTWGIWGNSKNVYSAEDAAKMVLDFTDQFEGLN